VCVYIVHGAKKHKITKCSFCYLQDMIAQLVGQCTNQRQQRGTEYWWKEWGWTR